MLLSGGEWWLMMSVSRVDGAVGFDVRDGGEIFECYGVVYGDEMVRG